MEVDVAARRVRCVGGEAGPTEWFPFALSRMEERFLQVRAHSQVCSMFHYTWHDADDVPR